jgi:HK97 family phage portal protein
VGPFFYPEKLKELNMKKWWQKAARTFVRTNPKQNGQKASSVGGLISYNTIGRAVWTPRRYESLTEEGYHKNVIVYRSVNLIARGAASVPWLLYQGNQEISRHPLLDLLDSPSPRQAGSAFIEAVLGYLLLSGNSYIEAIGTREKIPVELYPLRPDRMKILPSALGTPAGYEYTVNGHTRKLSFGGLSEKSSVLHLKLFNPLNDWYGMSPIEAAACSIDQHNTVAEHNLALLQNGGRPSGALIFRSNLTPEQKADLVQQAKHLYEGRGNAGRIMVLEGDFEWKELGLSPKDLDFIEGKNLSAREIAQAYNVPPMLVGIPGDATFANYKEARYHLWEDTILPLLDYLTDELNLWLTPQFGKDLSLSYDIDAIPALASRREEAWGKVAQADFLTINEKRHAVGYAPIENGDVLNLERGK